jgi:hypothetical protein
MDTTTFPSILETKFLLLTVYTAGNRKLPTTIFSSIRVLIVLHAIRLTGLFCCKDVVTDKGDHIKDARQDGHLRVEM